MVSEYIRLIEKYFSEHFDILIDGSITHAFMNLTYDVSKISKENLERVNVINKSNKILYTLNVFIELDADIKQGHTFITTHQLFFKHIVDETELLSKNVERLLNKLDLDPSYVYNSQYYYTNMMKEHSALLHGFIISMNQKYIKKPMFLFCYTRLY